MTISGVRHSLGAQRSSPSVIAPDLKSDAKNRKHSTNYDSASNPRKRDNKLVGRAACSINGMKVPLLISQSGIFKNAALHHCRPPPLPPAELNAPVSTSTFFRMRSAKFVFDTFAFLRHRFTAKKVGEISSSLYISIASIHRRFW